MAKPKLKAKAEITTVLYGSIAALFMGIILLGIIMPDYVTQFEHLTDLFGSMQTLFIGAVGALLGYFGLKAKQQNQEVAK